jgi:hypothetical protein
VVSGSGWAKSRRREVGDEGGGRREESGRWLSLLMVQFGRKGDFGSPGVVSGSGWAKSRRREVGDEGGGRREEGGSHC